MNAAPANQPRRTSRLPALMSAVVVLALLGVVCALSGDFRRGRAGVLGRQWPVVERVAIDEIVHGDWDRLLQRFVDDAGDVDYAAWKESSAALQALDDYLSGLSRAEPDRTSNREARLSFWINAYNALTIRGILREYSSAGSQNGDAPSNRVDFWRDVRLHVGDRDFSLGQIEHEILRPLREPRIHFAIVCGSRGCPRLLNHAYRTGDLEQQLRENSRNFFADPRKLEYDPATGRLNLSPILKWYSKDFGESERDVLETIAPYLPDRVTRGRPATGGLRAGYLEYDWSLNEQTAPASRPPVPPDTETTQPRPAAGTKEITEH